jgi:hypothetical protein
MRSSPATSKRRSSRTSQTAASLTTAAVSGLSLGGPIDNTESEEAKQLAGRQFSNRLQAAASTGSDGVRLHINGVTHQRHPIPPAARAISNGWRLARRPRGQRRFDQRRRGPRARARTHRSARYRSDLSCDPPSAAASAHETHRVLLGSCEPMPAGHKPLSRRSREAPSAFSCLFARLVNRGNSRVFAGES